MPRVNSVKKDICKAGQDIRLWLKRSGTPKNKKSTGGVQQHNKDDKVLAKTEEAELAPTQMEEESQAKRKEVAQPSKRLKKQLTCKNRLAGKTCPCADQGLWEAYHLSHAETVLESDIVPCQTKGCRHGCIVECIFNFLDIRYLEKSKPNTCKPTYCCYEKDECENYQVLVAEDLPRQIEFEQHIEKREEHVRRHIARNENITMEHIGKDWALYSSEYLRLVLEDCGEQHEMIPHCEESYGGVGLLTLKFDDDNYSVISGDYNSADFIEFGRHQLLVGASIEPAEPWVTMSRVRSGLYGVDIQLLGDGWMKLYIPRSQLGLRGRPDEQVLFYGCGDYGQVTWVRKKEEMLETKKTGKYVQLED
ncbi:hypothetical protein BS50DRAFT_570104 [Corynespora cassiicola Philippines]|uniref:Uncharacterized protein n=1 Tax=Corynespora cassiicola Philippines TaxID=1448308 RepID=A0A2T2P581_CORCC|nr:hypothetical protein BS50DRAFT_570104 [Corynespora cassiicola Philippines]